MDKSRSNRDPRPSAGDPAVQALIAERDKLQEALALT